MKALSLALLGPFEVSVNGKRLTRFRTSRAQALLVYLATEYALGAPQQGRETLMELLWPGMPPEISDVLLTKFTPANYAFAIWSVVYTFVIGFAVYQALPSQRDNPKIGRRA